MKEAVIHSAPAAAKPAAFFGTKSPEAFFSSGSEKGEATEQFFQKTGAQPRLIVGERNDAYEQQANAMADKVAAKIVAPEPVKPAPVQTKPAAIETADLQKKEDQKERDTELPPVTKLQKKPVFESEEPLAGAESIQRSSTGTEAAAPSSVESALATSKGGGSPLPDATRQSMESSFGADFSGVRVHHDTEASKMNNQLGAQAFTHGNDVYFGDGKYAPQSTEGNKLLAHELTHTIQQGASVKKKEKTAVNETPPVQMKEGDAAAKGPSVAGSEVVNISSGTFTPTEALAVEIEEAKHKGLDVQVNTGAVAGIGTIKVRGSKGKFDSVKEGKLPLNIPYLAAANPTLWAKIDNGTVTGAAGTDKAKAALPSWIQGNAAALGWVGIDIKSIAGKLTNSYEGGTLKLSINDVNVKVAEFADATLTAGFENLQKPVVNISATVKVKGIVDANLKISNDTGPLSGSLDVNVNFKAFSGSVTVAYKPDGTIDVKGTVAYAADKLSGSLTLIATDKATADNFARDQVGGGGNAAEAALPAEVPAPTGGKDRALAGMGTLTFNLTEWFAGSVTVIVDGKGDVTVVGKIAPPKEIELFPQKNFDKELFKMEARASYGIPVIGNVFVFANVGLSALARVGPAKIYNMEVEGTYSTDPGIAKSITISASLNLSAYAGLRLRAEGGAGIEILGHDIKLGVGINADAGVKGYIDARPTIGYRDPGEFFFKGHMEMAAQPVLGLSGDLFVDLDSPWWSPAPDKKWTWPIGGIEYPLPGQFGISADMEYVLGSGKVPEITFGKADFDGAKFMTDLVDNTPPGGAGKGKGDKAGSYVDGGAAGASPKPADKKGGDKGGAKPPPAKGGGKKDKGKDADKNDELKQMDAAMKKVKALEGGKALSKSEITAEVNKIKAAHNISITVKEQGSDAWTVTLSGKGKGSKQPAKVKRKKGDDKTPENADPKKQKQLEAGIKAIKDEDKKVAGDGKMKKEEAEKVASNVKGAHGDIFKSISVLDAGENWKYHYLQKSEGDVTGSKEEKPKLPDGYVVGTFIKSGVAMYKIVSVGKESVEVLNMDSESVKMVKKLDAVVKLIEDKKWVKASDKEIEDFNEKKFPEERKLPSVVSGEVIRDHYESFGWTGHSASLRATGVPIIVAEVNRVKALKNKVQQDKEWKLLKTSGWVKSTGAVATYDPSAQEYHVDHEPDLSKRWNDLGGRSNDDAYRNAQLTAPSLNVVEKIFNLSKKKTKYTLIVKKSFSSAKLASPPKSKTIMGQPYLDKSGKPLK